VRQSAHRWRPDLFASSGEEGKHLPTLLNISKELTSISGQVSPSPEGGNRSGFRNVVFSIFVRIRYDGQSPKMDLLHGF
jgi:hypothetical protein